MRYLLLIYTAESMEPPTAEAAAAQVDSAFLVSAKSISLTISAFSRFTMSRGVPAGASKASQTDAS